MNEDYRQRTINACVTLFVGISILYVPQKMNGEIKHAFFPFPQIDRFIMFMWSLVPYILGLLGIGLLGCLFYYLYTENKKERLKALEDEKLRFKQEILSEVEVMLEEQNKGRRELTDYVLAQLQKLEEGLETLKSPEPEYVEVTEDFKLGKLI